MTPLLVALGAAAGAPLRFLAGHWLGLLWAPLCLLAWEAVVRLLQVPLYIVPPPSAVLYQLWRNAPRIAEYTLVTGGETVGGPSGSNQLSLVGARPR